MHPDGKRIAILIGSRGTEDSEFLQPNGAVIGAKSGTASTVNGDRDAGSDCAIDKGVAEVSADAFDGLVISGGRAGTIRRWSRTGSSSRAVTPDDLPSFCNKIVEEFAEVSQTGQARCV